MANLKKRFKEFVTELNKAAREQKRSTVFQGKTVQFDWDSQDISFLAIKADGAALAKVIIDGNVYGLDPVCDRTAAALGRTGVLGQDVVLLSERIAATVAENDHWRAVREERKRKHAEWLARHKKEHVAKAVAEARLSRPKCSAHEHVHMLWAEYSDIVWDLHIARSRDDKFAKIALPVLQHVKLTGERPMTIGDARKMGIKLPFIRSVDWIDIQSLLDKACPVTEKSEIPAQAEVTA